ncbi:MAG: hypothetical protein IJF74_02160 [Clostridia bacterium]|nr:hypothetical protein [Clostridia bacterium]
MKKRIAALTLAIAALLLFPTAANADEEYLPTVYIADGVWYKDKSQPMITDGKDGFFIPIDAFGALPSVSVEYDGTVNALRLTFEDTAFSADIATGTVISPEGDSTVRIIRDLDTVYLNVDDVCKHLGIEYEPHFYSNGKRAVRINDGSGTLEMSVLVRMFVNQEDTLVRMTGEPVSVFPKEIVKASSATELEAAVSRLREGDRQFILALNADTVLSFGNAEALSELLSVVYAYGIPVTIYAHKENPDTVLHYVHSANARLLELMHKGTHMYTPTTELSDTDISLINERGFVITDFTFEEEK